MSQWVRAIVIGLGFFAASAGAHAKDWCWLESKKKAVCSQKKEDFGASFLACDCVSSGMTPVSASYQPENVAPMGVPSAKINDFLPDSKYIEPFPAINTTDQLFYDKKGSPIAFSELSAADKLLKITLSKLGSNSAVYQWLQGSWSKELQPRPGADGSNGICPRWSRWAVDPVVLADIQKISDQQTCHGLTRGQIKEISLALYQANEPTVSTRWFEKKRAETFYSLDQQSTPAQTMDANIGLAKLGLLGQGDLDPGKWLSDYREAVAAGKGSSFDRDHGSQVWNQPIAGMVDVSYKSAIKAVRLLSMSEFEPAGTANASKFNQLVDTEKKLTIEMAAGRAGSAQADVFNAAKEAAIEEGVMRPAPGGSKVNASELVSVMHDLTVIYGDENQFASQATDRTADRTFRYSSIMSGGKKLRSVFLPPVTKMSKLCKDYPSRGYLGFSAYDRKDKEGQTIYQNQCSKIESGQIPDYDVFAGAPPPRYVNFFEKGFKGQGPEAEVRKQAFDFFHSLLQDCPENNRPTQYAAALEFMKKLTEYEQQNQIPVSEIPQMKALYAQSEFLDFNWLTAHVCNTRGVQGMAELKAELQKVQPELCP